MSLLFEGGIELQKKTKTLDYLLAEETTLSQVIHEATIKSGINRSLRETEKHSIQIGDAIIINAQKRHEKLHGTRKDKEERWGCFQETQDKVFEENPNRPKTWIRRITATRSAKKLGLDKVPCNKTIERHTKFPE